MRTRPESACTPPILNVIDPCAVEENDQKVLENDDDRFSGQVRRRRVLPHSLPPCSAASMEEPPPTSLCLVTQRPLSTAHRLNRTRSWRSCNHQAMQALRPPWTTLMVHLRLCKCTNRCTNPCACLCTCFRAHVCMQVYTRLPHACAHGRAYAYRHASLHVYTPAMP